MFMPMAKILAILAILITISHVSKAQPQISFDTTEHNFGEIRELGGVAQYRFVFFNKGDKPLIISNVHTSCGCTSPAWQKEPVAPSKAGYIDVSFDPRDRPGAFTKSIVVTSNATSQPITLYISGNVTPRPEPLSVSYPYTMYDLRVKNNTINFGTVESGGSVSYEVEVVNPTAANILIESSTDADIPFVTLTPKPSVLKPGEKGVIKCVFNTALCSKRDYLEVKAPILINTYRYLFNIKITIVDELTSKNKNNSSELTLKGSNTIDIGTIDEGKKGVAYIKYENTGVSPLVVRAVRNASSDVSVVVDNTPLEPGASGEIIATINTEGLKGKITRYLTIVTNSVTNQLVICKLIANVQDER